MNRRVAVILVLSGLFLASGCARGPKKFVEFESAIKEVQSLGVMPADFSLAQKGAFTAELASEMKHDIEIELLSAIQALVSESKFKLSTLALTDSLLQANPDLQAAVFEMSNKLRAASEDLHKSSSKTIDVDFSGNLDPIADLAQAEHFLFVRGSGHFSTTGAQVLAGVMAGLFGGGAVVSSVSLEAYLVDANRGKVLWYNSVLEKNKDPRKPRDLLAVSKKLMKSLFGPSKLKGDKSRDEVIIQKYKSRLEQEQQRSAKGS